MLNYNLFVNQFKSSFSWRALGKLSWKLFFRPRCTHYAYSYRVWSHFGIFKRCYYYLTRHSVVFGFRRQPAPRTRVYVRSMQLKEAPRVSLPNSYIRHQWLFDRFLPALRSPMHAAPTLADNYASSWRLSIKSQSLSSCVKATSRRSFAKIYSSPGR